MNKSKRAYQKPSFRTAARLVSVTATTHVSGATPG